MHPVLKLIDKVTLYLSVLAAAAVVIMMVQITMDVVLRTLFNWPLPATLAIVSNYYMPLITFLPLAFVERLDQHIAADVLTQFLPARGQKHLFGWTFLLCCAVCALLTYATWIEAVAKYRIGAFEIERGIKILTWPVRFAAPFSYGLLGLLFFFKFVSYLAGAGADHATQGGLAAFIAKEDAQK